MKLKIASYNLRCIWTKGDGVNCFLHRAGMVLDKINAEKPDVICFQECIDKKGDFLGKDL